MKVLKTAEWWVRKSAAVMVVMLAEMMEEWWVVEWEHLLVASMAEMKVESTVW
jgi:hypothetical protein